MVREDVVSKTAVNVLVFDMERSLQLKRELTLLGHSVSLLPSVDELLQTEEQEGRMSVAAVVVAGSWDRSHVIETIKRIGSKATRPAILVTAEMAEGDRLTVLRLGAGAIIENSLSAREIALRIDRLVTVTHVEQVQAPEKGMWQLRDEVLVIDDEAHKTFINGVFIRLTETEWRLLHYLANHSGAICARETLVRNCMGYEDTGPYLRSLDAHVKNLRKKLGDSGWIETVRGYGYQFVGSRPK